MTASTRPELGAVHNGDAVYVSRSPNDMRGRDAAERYVAARVVKVARVWVTLETAAFLPSQIGHQTWRMRLDTQDEATDYSGRNDSFVTLAQREWDDTMSAARTFLDGQGIRVDRGSPWAGREVELADLIRESDLLPFA